MSGVGGGARRGTRREARGGIHQSGRGREHLEHLLRIFLPIGRHVNVAAGREARGHHLVKDQDDALRGTEVP